MSEIQYPRWRHFPDRPAYLAQSAEDEAAHAPDGFDNPSCVAAPETGAVKVPATVVPPQVETYAGPTFEEWIAAGYAAEHYPPAGFTEQPSDGLTAYRASQAKAAE